MTQAHLTRLGDIVEFVYGRALPKGQRREGSVPVYGANGITGWHDEALVETPAIIVGRKGSAGAVQLTKGPSYPIDTTYYIKPFPAASIDTKYLFYVLKQANLNGLATATGVPGLNREDAYRVDVPVPCLDEQRRIVDILDRADSVRRLRRQAQDTARQIVPALFNKVFGDPATNPMGWAVRQLGEVIAGFEGGRNLQADAESGAEGVLRILKVSAVTSGSFRAAESKPAPPGYIPPTHHFVRDGDLLISRANTAELVGATALVRNPPPTLLLPDKIWRILWRDPSPVTPEFLLAWFKQPGIRTAMSRLASGTSASMRNISQGRLSTVGIILPPLELQLQFAMQSVSLERLAMDQGTGQHIEHSLTVAFQANLFSA